MQSVSRKTGFQDFVKDVLSPVASTLNDGEQTREILCPACNGGQSKEKSFAVRKYGGVTFYRCWRAACRCRGRLVSVGSLLEPSVDAPLRAATVTYTRNFNGRLVPVPTDGEEYFEEQFGLMPHDLDLAEIKYASQVNKYAFPVHGSNWMVRGMSLRSFEPGVAKWDAYPTCAHDVPWMGWYIRVSCSFPNGPIVVVEDPISALKVARQYTACYLNGTNVDYDKLYEIMKVGRTRGVIFALDKDATSKAIDVVQKYSFYLGGMAQARPLEIDAKYMSDRAIRELFGGK